MSARRLEDHLDFAAAARRTCLSVGFLRAAVKARQIDPVVELPGRKRATTRVLIPESSLAKFLAQYTVRRNQEVPLV